MVFPVGQLRRVSIPVLDCNRTRIRPVLPGMLCQGRYPKLLEIMDVMQEPEDSQDVDVAAMWGLEAFDT